MKAPRILLSLLFSSLLLQAHALIPTDRKQRLTEHWEFIRQDMGSIWEVMRPITGAGKPETVPLWQKVTLPHCFNAEDAVDPDVNYYQGPGWYRTMLNIENPYTNGRTCLEFEGAGQKTEVYVYTTRIASHVGGYDEWKADITEAVEAFRRTPLCRERFGGKIPIAIRCDNSRDTELIPSDMSDFNLYGENGELLAVGYCYEAFGIMVNKALLTQAGYADGITITTYIPTADAVMTILQQQLAEANIHLDVQLADAATVSDMRVTGKLACWLLTWYADYNDADEFFYGVFNSNVADFFSTGWRNAEFDAKLEQCRAINDMDEKAEIYRQLDREITWEQYGNVPLYYPGGFYLTSDRVSNVFMKNDFLWWWVDGDIVG